jgi:hypothetical protein
MIVLERKSNRMRRIHGPKLWGALLAAIGLAGLSTLPAVSAPQEGASSQQRAAPQHKLSKLQEMAKKARQAPLHGGVTAPAGKAVAEVVFLPDGLRLYVSNGEGDPLDAGKLGGSVELGGGKGQTTRLELAAPEGETGYLTAAYDFSETEKGAVMARVTLEGLPGGETTFTVPYRAARTEAYTCPMHPDVVQAEAGSCPECGMDLVKARGYYGCPMHPEVESHDKAQCWKCGGMELVIMKDEPGTGEEGAGAQPVEGHEGHGGHEGHEH